MRIRKAIKTASYALAAMIPLTISLSALLAYVPSRADSGTILRRDLGTVPFQFKLSDQISPLLPNITDDSDPMAAIRRSFEAWQNIPTASIAFSTQTTSETSVGRSVPNIITFSDTAANRQLVQGALAVTQVSFNFTSPYYTITRSDMAFNPDVMFSTTLAARTYDIQAVCTHEIGHALGAGHTGVLEATMYWAAGMQESLKRTLAADDIAYVSALYPKSGSAAQFGTITGTARLNGAALFGAHIVAFDENGANTVGILTNPNGTYTMTGLPPGRYMMYAEPLDGPAERGANSGTAGSYFASMNSSFPSTFLGTVDNPQLISVVAGQTVSNADFNITNISPVMNIEMAGRSAGPSPSSITVYTGPFSAQPGERFVVALAGSSLNRVTSLSQIRLYGNGVRVATGATLLRLNFGSVPGIGFLVDVAPDAVEGSHSILAGDGVTYALLTGGLVITGGPTSPTTTTSLPITTTSTSSSTTSTLVPTTTTSSTTTSTLPPITTSSSTTTSTLPPITTSSSTTTSTLPPTTTSSSTTSSTLPPITTTSSTSSSTLLPTTTSTIRLTTTSSTTTTTTASTTTTSSTTTTTLAPGQPYLLHFPFLYSDVNLFTGIALANPSPRPATLTITAYNSSGTQLSGGTITNPTTLTLPPGTQSAQIVDQIFHFLPGIPQKGWFEVSSDNPSVTGFYLVGDYTQLFIDGADVGAATSNDLVLPGLVQMPSFGTEISLVNPDPRRSVQATLFLYDESGRLLSTMERTVNPMGRIYGSISSLFGISNLNMGHMEIHSDRGLAGAMISGEALRIDGGPANRLAVFRAQPRRTAPQRLYLPQYVVGGSYSSRVYLANAAVQAATVRLTLFGSDGHALAAPLIRTIGPRSGLSLPPSSFGLSESSSKTVDGYLQLDVESGSVVGNVTFQDLSGTLFLAGTNTLVEASMESYMSQVASGFSGYYTGVACMNISGMPALVNVMVYDAGGRLLAQGSRILLAGQRFSELLSQLTGFYSQLQGGYIRILSSQPVISFGVVGTDRTLASVPAQIPGQ